MGYADNLPPGLRADDAIPARLHSPNRIHIMILSTYKWDTYYLFWTLNGGPEQTTRILDQASAAGTVDHDFYPESGGYYTFQVQGCPVNITGPSPPGDGHCSPRSDVVTAVAAINQKSVRTFLQINGIDPASRGLRSYGVGSIRGLLNGQ
jgi:hypothetical protein